MSSRLPTPGRKWSVAQEPHSLLFSLARSLSLSLQLRLKISHHNLSAAGTPKRGQYESRRSATVGKMAWFTTIHYTDDVWRRTTGRTVASPALAKYSVKGLAFALRLAHSPHSRVWQLHLCLCFGSASFLSTSNKKNSNGGQGRKRARSCLARCSAVCSSRRRRRRRPLRAVQLQLTSRFADEIYLLEINFISRFHRTFLPRNSQS